MAKVQAGWARVRAEPSPGGPKIQAGWARVRAPQTPGVAVRAGWARMSVPGVTVAVAVGYAAVRIPAVSPGLYRYTATGWVPVTLWRYRGAGQWVQIE